MAAENKSIYYLPISECLISQCGLSEFHWVGSLTGLPSRCWPALQLSQCSTEGMFAFRFTQVAIITPQVVASSWPEVSVPCHHWPLYRAAHNRAAGFSQSEQGKEQERASNMEITVFSVS